MARSAAISRCDQWIATIHEAQRSPSSSGRQPVPSTTHRRSSWRKEHSARVCADSCSGAVRDGRCRAIAMPRSGSRGLHLLLGRDAYLAIRAPTPSLRGKKGRHRPRNATSRAWQCLRSYGFSDRERDENCALAIAWKHTLTAPRRHRGRRHDRTIPRARALRRKAGVRISAGPSSSSLVLAPRSKRARAGRGTTALTLAPARAGLLQRHAPTHRVAGGRATTASPG